MRTLTLLATAWTVGSVTALADLPVYTSDALSSPWENWSWNSAFNWAFTGPTPAVPAEFGTAVEAATTSWAGISFRLGGGGDVSAYRTLVFHAAGDSPAFGLRFEVVADNSGYDAGNLATACSEPLTTSKFVPCYVDLTKIDPAKYDRITVGSQRDANQLLYLANVYFTEKTALELTDSRSYTSGAIIGSSTLMMVGTGSPTKVTVTKAGSSKPLKVSHHYSTNSTVPRAYIHFKSAFTSGTYTVSHVDGSNKTTTFTVTVPQSTKANISYPRGIRKINKNIYGVNFPPTAKYLADAGIPLSRWGGNAMTTYNPNGHFINAANDWYFMNRLADEGGFFSWMDKIVLPGGSKAITLVSVLDWVAKNQTCWSYSVAKYGEQEKVEPWNADAGNGILKSNGSRIINDPSDCYEPWTPAKAYAWIKSWPQARLDQVEYFALDNELDICDGTHPDIHPGKMTYDEELDRLYRWGSELRRALGDKRKIIGPVSCCFWFWFHSSAGEADMAAHNGTGKIRYLLRELRKKERQNKVKLLDVVDLHFNPQEGRTGNGSDVDNASRLRSTRAWWDWTYLDESYAGSESVWPVGEEKKGYIAFIPRFKKMIQEEYPGLGLGVSEWYNNNDLVGGLQIADTLGIFGREGLEFATKWGDVPPGSPGASAYWLFLGGRNSTTPFPDQYIDIPMFFDPNTAGVYFAKGTGGAIAGVFVNKDPKKYQSYSVKGFPRGRYVARHFGAPLTGGKEGARLETVVNIDPESTVIVPPYSAIFLQFQSTRPHKELAGTVYV